MIVQCPSCSKRYRVDDSNIPPSGGKIRCPECSHAFVVYPESDSDPEPNPGSHENPGEKTSVAQRPNMEELLNSMQGGEGAGDAGGGSANQGGDDGEEEVAKTEVMAGSELPDFNNLFGEGGPSEEDDATVEMQNPLSDMDSGGSGDPGHQDPPAVEDDLKTQQLDSDIVDQSLGHVREQAEQSPPVDDSAGDFGQQTQVTPPPNVDQVPSSGNNQQRASIPDEPTPPPASNPAPSGGGPSTNTGSGPAAGPGSMPGDSPSSSSPSGPADGPSTGPASAPSTRSQSSPGTGGFGAEPAGGAGQPPATGPGESGPSGPSSDPSGPAPAPGGGGPDPNHGGPWKLETNFGLTYEFADNESLRSWLESRDDLDGYELSADDGDTFYPLDEFPQFGGGANPATSGGNAQISSTGKQSALSGSGSQPSPGASGGGQSGPVNPGSGAQDSSGFGSGAQSSPGFGSGSQSTPGSSPGGAPGGSGPLPRSTSDAGGGQSPFQTAASPAVGGGSAPDQGADGGGDKKERINPDDKFEPPSRDGKLLNIVLWSIFGILAITAIGLALQLSGVIDVVGDDEDADAEGAVVQQEEPAGEEVEEEPDEDIADDGPSFDDLMDSAREEMADENFEGALEHLQQARLAEPENVRLYDLKADAHAELGEDDASEQQRERARILREDGELPEEELPEELVADEEPSDEAPSEEESE